MGDLSAAGPIRVDLAAPTLLVAVPQLADPNFRRAVVLLAAHDEAGSMGLVLNRPSPLSFEAFCATQNVALAGDAAGAVHHGGPVQGDRAFILHGSRAAGPETEPVADGVDLSYSQASLRALAAQPPHRLRVFLGYAGWGPGQLGAELGAGAWLTASPSAEHLFAVHPDGLWEAVLGDLGIAALQLAPSGARN